MAVVIREAHEATTIIEPQVHGESSNLQRTINSLKVGTSSVRSEAADVELKHSTQQVETLKVRNEFNDIIGAINLATQATEEISDLGQSISGIVQQVAVNEDPRQRKLLEAEAQQLVSKIKDIAKVSTQQGVKPLAGDSIRLEIEENLGKTLDLILPDDAKEAFGIGVVDFSTKDSILATIASVTQAKQRIENLRNALKTTRVEVSKSLDNTEVALQNSEASRTSVRDVDSALSLATETHAEITTNPKGAIDSVGSLGNEVLGLLK